MILELNIFCYTIWCDVCLWNPRGVHYRAEYLRTWRRMWSINNYFWLPPIQVKLLDPTCRKRFWSCHKGEMLNKKNIPRKVLPSPSPITLFLTKTAFDSGKTLYSARFQYIRFTFRRRKVLAMSFLIFFRGRIHWL